MRRRRSERRAVVALRPARVAAVAGGVGRTRRAVVHRQRPTVVDRPFRPLLLGVQSSSIRCRECRLLVDGFANSSSGLGFVALAARSALSHDEFCSSPMLACIFAWDRCGEAPDPFRDFCCSLCFGARCQAAGIGRGCSIRSLRTWFVCRAVGAVSRDSRCHPATVGGGGSGML